MTRWTVTATHCFPDQNGSVLFVRAPYDFWRIYCPMKLINNVAKTLAIVVVLLGVIAYVWAGVDVFSLSS